MAIMFWSPQYLETDRIFSMQQMFSATCGGRVQRRDLNKLLPTTEYILNVAMEKSQLSTIPWMPIEIWHCLKSTNEEPLDLVMECRVHCYPQCRTCSDTLLNVQLKEHNAVGFRSSLGAAPVIDSFAPSIPKSSTLACCHDMHDCWSSDRWWCSLHDCPSPILWRSSSPWKAKI